MLQTNSRDGAARFIPSPLQGLTLLISREGFSENSVSIKSVIQNH